jgi:HEAT repeat protein
VIEEMMNREFLNRLPEMSDEQRESVMMNAIHAAALLKERSLAPTLRALKASDPSLKVRQAAMEALGAIEGTVEQVR